MFTKFAATLGFSTDVEKNILNHAAATGDSGVFHGVLVDGGFALKDKRMTKAQAVKLFTAWSVGAVPKKADKKGVMRDRKPGTSEHFAFMLFGVAALSLINDKNATLCLAYDADLEAAITAHSAAQKALKASKPQTAAPTAPVAVATEAATAPVAVATALELMDESPSQAVTPDPTTGMTHAVLDFVRLVTAGAFTIAELQYVMDACMMQAESEGYTVR